MPRVGTMGTPVVSPLAPPSSVHPVRIKSHLLFTVRIGGPRARTFFCEVCAISRNRIRVSGPEAALRPRVRPTPSPSPSAFLVSCHVLGRLEQGNRRKVDTFTLVIRELQGALVLVLLP